MQAKSPPLTEWAEGTGGAIGTQKRFQGPYEDVLTGVRLTPRESLIT